jgi:hypothetical protein
VPRGGYGFALRIPVQIVDIGTRHGLKVRIEASGKIVTVKPESIILPPTMRGVRVEAEYDGGTTRARVDDLLSNFAIQLIDKITSEQELREINKHLIDRIRNLRAMNLRSRALSGELAIGKRVHFASRGGGIIRGRVEKINSKTIVIEATDGMIWRVSPGLVQAD